MKLIKFESNAFSMEDFEKGLMLAGLISPNSIEELEEREKLDSYEKQLKGQQSKTYFKRVVLAAEIVYELHKEPTFGRIKFQKLVYLCEHAAKMNLENRYRKQAAGPFDNKFMHSIEGEFLKQNWFKVEKKKEANFTKSIYTLLPEASNYKPYYESYFKHSKDEIKYLIDLFRNKKTDFTEIAATLLACFWELKEKNEVFSEDRLITLFYNWSDQKKRFDQNTVLKIWQWSKDNHLVNNY
ncbi:hypothetical protein [Adhaeribacter soli]|uniref:Uncharacterized protein n=1 Tax=Adhaeribacter soli TaxID=2607655 RepID=A0A5N1IY02_9BACT|nr:hypothetical protein [Adhaeribacter soli]KAA9338988.1 hypothetical protein F0P94_09360 [Adhaeribacter soli]